MSATATLLELQEHDVKLDQLRHRRASLPDRTELAALTAASTKLGAEIAVTAAERDTVALEQKRLEDAAALVVDKAKAEDKKLYSGTISAPKELQSIQDEIASLNRRRNALEDDVLVQMELAEPLDERLGESGGRKATLDAQLGEVADRLRAAELVIDTEATTVQAERDELAAQIDAVLLGQYEELRRRLGGVAVARLEGSSCRGCHLQLAAVELERIRKLDRDAVVHCEECGRILVR
jgi:predicted  nucleic acid-binding Zn-ribbon protein